MQKVKSNHPFSPSTVLALLATFAMILAVLAVPYQVIAKRPTIVPTASPTPEPVEDPAVTKTATQQFISWQAGAINRKLYTPSLSALITQQKLDETSTELGALGAFVSSQFVDVEPVAMGVPAGSKTYLYEMHGTVGMVYMQFSIAPNSKIASLAFRDSIYDFHPTPSPSPTPLPTPEPTDTPDEGL